MVNKGDEKQTSGVAPDLNPITIFIHSLDNPLEDNAENKYGFIVSPYIGVKVLMTYVCPQLNYAPTKANLF